jgi:23S rRNA pseudouridine955/2504/2580 synthase
MSKVQNIDVAEADDGIRLDRWFKRHYPALKHGRLEKLLRKGQIRVDGGRVKANARLEAGQTVRVPPLDDEDTRARAPRPKVSDEDRDFIQSLVMFQNSDLIALNKPPGLAVQGGSKTTRHIDGLLEGLRPEGGERPKLVHRLDKDTSGVLVLAKTAKSAARLARMFQGRDVEKIYWCLTVGVPHPLQGTIDLPLAKRHAGAGGEQMVPAKRGEEDAQKAITHYAVVENTGKKAAWIAVMPVTGRTHQIRAHMAALGTPIVGDGKYGGEAAFLGGNISKKLHLHARRLVLPGGMILTAPLGDHMRKTWEFLGFDPENDGAPFAELPR